MLNIDTEAPIRAKYVFFNRLLAFFAAVLTVSAILLSDANPVHAQQTYLAAGGNATGSGGSAGYSVGQAVYMYNTGSNGSVSHGVQQADVPTVPLTLSYTTPNNFTVGTSITPLTPTASGVEAPAYHTERTSVGSDFSLPSGAAVDIAGNMYVADRNGNALKKIGTDGNTTVVDAGLSQPFDVAMDGKGNLYIADYGNNRIRKIPAGGGATVTVDANVSATTIAADVNGNVYYTGSGKLYKLPADGSARVTVDESVPAFAYGLAADNFGNVYLANVSENKIYKYPAGGGARQAVVSGSAALVGLQTDAAGNIYFNEAAPGYATYLVKKLSAADNSVSTVLSGLPETFRIALDSKGNLYLLETYPDYKIEKMTPKGGYHAGYLPAGLKLDDATGVISGTPTAPFNADYKITAYNSSGGATTALNINIPPPLPTLTYNTPNSFNVGEAITPLTPTASGVEAPAYHTERTSVGSGFSLPSGAAIDTAGNIYVADRNGNALKKIGTDGNTTVVDAGLNQPFDVAMDGKGNLYIADYGNNRIRKKPAGGGATVTVDANVSATTIAADVNGNVYYTGSGKLYKLPADGSARVTVDESVPAFAYGLAADNFGNVYLANVSENKIYKYPAGGGARQAVVSGSAALVGLQTDAAGNIYFNEAAPDYATYLVKKLSAADNSVSTVLSGLPETFRIALDSKGNLYLLETYPDYKIEKITPKGGYYAGYLPAGLKLDDATGVISGTPTAPFNVADYKITAYNIYGLGSANINIRTSYIPQLATLNTQSITDVSLKSVTVGDTITNTGYSDIVEHGVVYSLSANPTTADHKLIIGGTDAGSYSATLSKLVPNRTYYIRAYAINEAGTAYGNELSFTTPAQGPVTLDKLGQTDANLAAGAYSTRLLGTDYAGPLARVYVNSNYYDVYPDTTAAGAISASSPISASISTYNGAETGATNTTFSTILPGNTIKVSAWYDQSGSGNTAVQSNDAIRPRLALTGVLDTLNNAATLTFSGGQWLVVNSTAFNRDLSGSVVYKATPGNTQASTESAWYVMNGMLGSEQPNDVNDFAYGVYGGKFTAGFGRYDNSLGSNSTVNDNTRRISSWTRESNTGALSLYNNGVEDGSATFNSGERTSVPSVAIGAVTVNGGGNFFGNISELALFPAVYQGGQRQLIESSQARYYGVTIPAPNTSLSNLVVSEGSLTPAFNKDSLNYQDTVGADVYHLNITATAADPGATIIIAGEEVSSGNSSSAIDLYQGDNEIEVIVKAVNDTTSTTYKINIYRTPSLPVIDYGGHTFTFKAGSPNGIAPTGENVEDVGYYDRGSVIGQRYTSPKGIAIDSDGNIFVADDITKNVYKISAAGDTTVYASGLPSPTAVAADGNGNIYVANTNGSVQKVSSGGSVSDIATGLGQLKGIAVSRAGKVYVTDYSNNKVLRIPESGAPVEIGSGFVHPKGIAIDSVGFMYVVNGGSNSLQLIYQDTVISDYTALTAPSSIAANASGTAYVVDEGKINTFLPIMGAAQPFNYPTENIAAVTADKAGNVYATSTTTGRAYKFKPLGGYFISPALPEGMFFDSYSGSIIAFQAKPTPAKQYVVTAYNNGLLARDTLTIGVEASADLYDVVLSAGTLSPCFCSGDLNYTASVDNSVDTLRITPIPEDPNATIKINGIPTNYTTGLLDTLNVGDNIYSIVVTSQDSSITKTYTITVNRGAPPSAKLQSLDLSAGTLSPNFSPDSLTYSAVITGVAGNVTITPASVDPAATITVNGNAVLSGTPTTLDLDIGTNSVAIVVTNGDETKTYNLTLTRTISNNAKVRFIVNPLSVLVSKKTTSTYNYSTSVSQDISSINLKATAEGPGAVIRINGDVVESGKFSDAIMLNDGPTVINVAVTAQDGVTVRNYAITVNRTGSNNSKVSLALNPLSALTSITGTADYNYTTSVSADVTSINLKATAQQDDAVIRINGNVVKSGDFSDAIMLSNDPTVINVSVTAEDRVTVTTYAITVNRSLSNNARVSLTFNPGLALIGTAGSSTYNYTTSVSSDVSSIKVKATAQQADAVIRINGNLVESGHYSDDIALNAGPTVISVSVTAQDGVTVNTYKITVSRGLSNNAKVSLVLNPLLALTSTTGTSTYNYTTSVSADVSSINLKATAQQANAVIRINGNVVESGTFSDDIALNAGSTVIKVLVTAQDGVTVNSYTITVNRGLSNNARVSLVFNPLSKLVTTTGTSTYNYTTSVSADVSSVSVKPTAEQSNAVIRINGDVVQSGVFSNAISLNPGSTVVNIVVTAQDGVTINTYTITINRGLSNNARATLTFDPSCTLTGTTGAAKYNYTTSVSGDKSSIRVKAAAQQANAVIRINGDVVQSDEFSDPITLSDDPTTINVSVTAQDGITINTYAVTVTRNGSSDATATFKLTPYATLRSATGTASKNYAATVPQNVTNISVVPKLTDANATVTINGVLVANNTASQPIALTNGTNVINAIITAPDGTTTKTYNLYLTRQMTLLMVDKASAAVLNKIKANSDLSVTDNVVVHPAVSPNGDGSNDFLVIEGLSDHPGNRLAIMNTTGTLVFETRDYGKDGANLFDGHSKTGVQLKPGTYYYQLDYKVGKEDKRKTGFIILKY